MTIGKYTFSKRFLAIAALVLVLLVLMIYAAAHPKAVDSLMYNLTAGELPMNTDPWTGGRELLGIPYAQNSDSQNLDLYLPESDEPLPLFVLVHGGGFVYGNSQSRQAQWMYRFFRDQGYACASINYRLAQEAAYPAAVEDTKAAVRFLRSHAEEYGIDPDRIAIYGESAGGYLAAMAALSGDDQFSGVKYIGQEGDPVSAKVDVLVDYYGVSEFDSAEAYREAGVSAFVGKAADFGMMIPSVKAAGYEGFLDYFIRVKTADLGSKDLTAYLPATYLAARKPGELKAIFVHGELDITVPVTQTRHLAAAMKDSWGEASVYTIYPYESRHADDNLYSEEILSQVLEQMNLAFAK